MAHKGALDIAAAGLFTEARRLRSSDDIVMQVREAIVDGRLQAGERLPNERDLCVTFGVSRATLREALRVLESLGAVEIRPGSAGGIFACEPDGDQVGSALEALLRFRQVTAEELSEFRVSFESETANWAAQRADADDIRSLEEIAQRFSELAGDDDVPWNVLVELDIGFHEALAHASKNQVRVAIMLGIHRALHQASSSIADYASPPVRRAIGGELRRIAAAVAAHDPGLAVKRMRRHVKKFTDLERDVQQHSA